MTCTLLRFLAQAYLCAALVSLVTPARTQAAVGTMPDCCAQMQMASAGPGCPAHQSTPMKERDSSCCQGCALIYSMLFVAPASFVYAQTGEATFLIAAVRSHGLSHRPPVPPPRALCS